jgi:glycine betaine/choline ABC-type transport system substrate-binding protein
MNRRTFTAGLLAMSLAGCLSRRKQISVGSKNFTEQLILGELLAQTLEHYSSTPVERRFYLAGTYICHQALLAGRIDMYVEYTGTALGAILKERSNANHDEVLKRVTDEYRRKFDLAVMPPLGFNNSFAVIMRGEDSLRFSVRTLSELAQLAPHLRLGVGYEFLERQDGFAGLASAYKLKFLEAPRVMDLGLLYRAIEAKRVDVIVGSNTDGLIPVLKLVVLDDDRRYFPPYDAVPIVRHASLNGHPALAEAMGSLSGRISAEQMRKMNYAADGEKRDVTEIAKEFLTQQRLFTNLSKGWNWSGAQHQYLCR